MYFYVIKFGNENEIHLAGYKRSKVAALKLNAASPEKEKEDRNRFWQNSQMTFDFFPDCSESFIDFLLQRLETAPENKNLNHVQWSRKKRS